MAKNIFAALGPVIVISLMMNPQRQREELTDIWIIIIIFWLHKLTHLLKTSSVWLDGASAAGFSVPSD